MTHGKRSFYKAGYKILYPEYSRHGMTPWQHYVIDGRRKGFDNGCHPSDTVFFPEGYEAEYPDVKDSGADPWRHYAEKGLAEGRDNGLHPDFRLFFPEGYLEMYPDAAKSGMDPWRHYVTIGRQEGRDNGWHPGDDSFFPEGYRHNYPESVSEPYGDDPWLNYIKVGKQANRNNGLEPAGPFFYGAYLESHPGCSSAEAWRHFVLNSLKSPGTETDLYPAGSGMREVLRKKNPSVAVIMPVYNVKPGVMQAVESVLNQSWTNWHLYIVDDFSEDGTYDYLRSEINDPRITLLKSGSKGVSSARNTAIALIKNYEYAAYLEADKTWNREYLELMLCRLTETNTCCCYGALKRLRKEKDGSVRILDFAYPPFDALKLRELNCINISVFMHRACVFNEIGAFDTSLRSMEDWDWILRCAERYSFSRLPYVSCNAEESENSTGSHGSSSDRCLNAVRNRYWTDWKYLSDCAVRRDKSLVTVIVYSGRGDSAASMRNCLEALKDARMYGGSEYRTEIIIADDSCSEERHGAVAEFCNEGLADKYLINKMECGFPLSSNRALGLADGYYVVYLDVHSHVSVSWLDALISPLKRHSRLKGTSPKLVQQDGTISSAGCLFDSVSGLPYDALRGFPSDFPAAERPALIPGVNSCCCAFRTADVISKNGLSCIYKSRLAIQDLCLRLSDGQPCFAFVPGSSAVSYSDVWQAVWESADLGFFAERWHGKKVYGEQAYYERKNLSGYIKCRQKLSDVSYTEYSTDSCTKCSASYCVPVYDFSGMHKGKSQVPAKAVRRESAVPADGTEDRSVTTIILTYNHELYISQAIESALMQDYDGRHRILISDDLSSDNTRQIIRSYAERYSNIITDISNDVNKGFSGNVRHCLEHVDTRFVEILEGDDYYSSPDKIKIQTQTLLSHPEYMMTFAKLKIFNAEILKFYGIPWQDQFKDSVGLEDFLNKPSLNLVVNFTSCMFRTDLLRNLPERAFFPRLSEITVSFMALKYGRIGFNNTSLNIWRNHAGSLWFGKSKLQQLKDACEIRKTIRAITGIKKLDPIIADYEKQIEQEQKASDQMTGAVKNQ